MNDDEVEEKLGRPNKIIGSLVEGFKRVPRPVDKRTKLISVMPFISLVIFFVLGFAFDGWTYSWMAFLLIPMVAIVSEMGRESNPHISTALSPFIAQFHTLY